MSNTVDQIARCLMQEAATMIVLTATAWILGWLVINKGMRVNYTRKILRIQLLVLPIVLILYIPYAPTTTTCLIKGVILTGMFVTMCEPCRRRLPLAQTCFAALDRPEDRPHTLLLLTTQSAACMLIIVATASWLGRYNAERLILIGVLLDGLGDALAEPVGIAFGRCKYRTRSLFSGIRQWRTLEGSACVFLSAIFALFLVQNEFSSIGFVIALLVVPPLVTLAEAWSPHTWDGPFLYLTSASASVGVLEISSLLA